MLPSVGSIIVFHLLPTVSSNKTGQRVPRVDVVLGKEVKLVWLRPSSATHNGRATALGGRARGDGGAVHPSPAPFAFAIASIRSAYVGTFFPLARTTFDASHVWRAYTTVRGGFYALRRRPISHTVGKSDAKLEGPSAAQWMACVLWPLHRCTLCGWLAFTYPIRVGMFFFFSIVCCSVSIVYNKCLWLSTVMLVSRLLA